MSEVTDRMTRLIDGFDARVQAAPADAWTNVSPCEGWTARDVVTHVSDNFINIVNGLTASEHPTMSDDESAPDGWARASTAMRDALATADLSVNLPGPMGPMPAEQVLGRLVASDVLVHTWDLARAVGGDEQLPADLVAGAYSGLKPMDAMIRRPGVFGPKTPCPEGADEQTEFLCFLGRPV